MHAHRPSRTAVGIAAARARESARPAGERLFHDPYAWHFLPRATRFVVCIPPLRWLVRWHNRRTLPGMFGGLVARTRYFDDHLLACLRAGTTQVVILGAGYDARAYRFDEMRQGVGVFEVDHPATQAAKKAILTRLLNRLPSHVRYVAMDFNSDDLAERLTAHGYSARRRTLFIWEGVTMYLSAAAVDATLRSLTQQAPAGSSLIFDCFPPSVADGSCAFREARTLRRRVARYGEHFRFGLAAEAIPTYLTERGFRRVTSIDAQDCKARYFTGSYADLSVSRLFRFVAAEVA
ncbi:MAG: SAM-dependent methyltransferase [Desulfosarcinaceae bacterium]|nr:SAM-dependent methyltransferase [Desulfosarcinaceae bacterium]